MDNHDTILDLVNQIKTLEARLSIMEKQTDVQISQLHALIFRLQKYLEFDKCLMNENIPKMIQSPERLRDMNWRPGTLLSDDS